MKIVNLVQGSPEWHAHRAAHFNASDAPAMLNVSPYKTRAQLVKEYATGATEEVDAATQRRFNDGHRFEALARPIAEQIIGEELYPCVGVEGSLSASFDGLTLLNDVAFEHKTLNDALRIVLDTAEEVGADGSVLPEHYRVQMEQQCLVSGASRVLFVASKWEGESCVERRHCWYTPDLDLRARIVAGWEQFAKDVAAYQHAEAAPVAVGRSPEQLPTLRIEVTGMVTASNLEQFKAHALAVFAGINTNLQTDQDFADAERTVKWCGDIEDRLKAAKDAALAQTESIDALFRAIDAISAEARAKRLELDKLVKTRKDAVRAEIVGRARKSVLEHVTAINATLGEYFVCEPASLTADIAAAIKGKKTLTSISEAADAAAANAKIAVSQYAERIRASVATLAQHAAGFEHLFADRVGLCATKTPEDLRNLIAARIAEHKQREEQRLEAERERIRKEEAAKLEREAARKAEQSRKAEALEREQAAAGLAIADANEEPKQVIQRVPLEFINARIAPLSITAEGLAALGFTSVDDTYPLVDFTRVCMKIIDVIRCAAHIKDL